MKYFCTAILVTLLSLHSFSQNYHAIQGSSYAGSLGIDNNPASIVNTPYPWDINLLSFQVKYATNAVQVVNYSLLSSPADSRYRVRTGNYSRFGVMNFNLHLLNARFALSRKQGIAFGLNLKSYTHINASRYNVSDTMKGINDFLIDNQANPFIHARVRSSTWMEIFGTYSRTLWENHAGRLNGGVTLKALRGISGGFFSFDHASFLAGLSSTNRPEFQVTSAAMSYGYSANYDKWTKARSTGENLRDMLVSSEGGVSMDVGFEYLIKTPGISSFGDEDNYYDYDWKIGASLVDLGRNQYKPGRESRLIDDPSIGVSAFDLERKFRRPSSFRALNDSLASVIDGISRLAGVFSIINPARLVINADRWMGGDFYLNGEVSVNLSAVPGIDKLHVSEMNFLTVTPRWETRKYGLYLPMQYNTSQKFWIGGAFKLGPLVAGLHNLGNVFSSKKMQNGGGYLALRIKPRSITRTPKDGRNDCPRLY